MLQHNDKSVKIMQFLYHHRLFLCLVRRQFTHIGYERTEDHVWASDGRKALEAIRPDKLDLVVFDLMLPEVSGMEVCRMIRGVPETAGLPTIMLTAK